MRSRVQIVVFFATLVLAAWVWLGKMVWGMAAMDMSECSMSMPSPTGLNHLAWLTVMWAVMMTAMMLPSAAPMTWAFARFARAKGRNAEPGLPTAAFVGGYLLAWITLSLAAALSQWGLERATLMSSMAMALRSETLAGGVLLVAGLYQWMPLKHACLRRCRTPIGFLMTQWREGAAGALVMGCRHGALCVGCCWALMLLLFATGVMNPLWIALITVFVVVEKVLPFGDRVAHAAGLGLIGWGLWMIATAANVI